MPSVAWPPDNKPPKMIIQPVKAIIIEGTIFTKPRLAAKKWATTAAYRYYHELWQSIKQKPGFFNPAVSEAELMDANNAVDEYNELFLAFCKKATKRALPIFTKLLQN